MAYTPFRFYHDTPGTTTTVLSAASQGTYIIKQILLANSNAASKTVTIALDVGGASGLVASGTGANVIVPTVSIPANTVITLDVSLVVNNTDVIRGLQETASAITVSIHGMKF
jgi:hypothetical protein